MATKKIIVVPCIVNMRLKTSGDTKSLCAVTSCTRMTVASMPPITRHASAYTMYMMPSRLWSTVVTHSCSRVTSGRVVASLGIHVVMAVVAIQELLDLVKRFQVLGDRLDVLI